MCTCMCMCVQVCVLCASVYCTPWCTYGSQRTTWSRWSHRGASFRCRNACFCFGCQPFDRSLPIHTHHTFPWGKHWFSRITPQYTMRKETNDWKHSFQKSYASSMGAWLTAFPMRLPSCMQETPTSLCCWLNSHPRAFVPCSQWEKKTMYFDHVAW